MAAEAYFGASKVIHDYGKQSPVTSQCVRRHLYQPNPADWDGLLAHWQLHKAVLLTGHTALDKYVPPLQLADTLAFLRNPLARCFSEYLHVSREQRYKGTFRSFFSDRTQINRQLRALSGVPFQALAVVGLTERYRESLSLINDRFEWAIGVRKVNKAGWFSPKLNRISASDRAIFSALNTADLALYRAACDQLDQRLRLQQFGQPFVHGNWTIGESGQISGWAWWAGERSEEPVAVELWRNGERLETQHSSLQCAQFSGHVAPRAGRVGFVFEKGMDDACQASHALQVSVERTGQVLSSA